MSDEPRTTERSYASLGLAESDARSCEFIFAIDDVIASGERYSAVRRLLDESGYAVFMCGMFLARVT
jgi:adenine/guanine phosphoribosyltransferase-like PRPP-binding protein